jgi:hypothetical protein
MLRETRLGELKGGEVENGRRGKASLLEGVVGMPADGEHLVAGSEDGEERARDGVRPREALHPHQRLRRVAAGASCPPSWRR